MTLSMLKEERATAISVVLLVRMVVGHDVLEACCFQPFRNCVKTLLKVKFTVLRWDGGLLPASDFCKYNL